MTEHNTPSAELPPGAAEARILFVSHLPAVIARTSPEGRFGPDIEVVDFTAVSAELLKDFEPHFVVSPIMTSGFDILDLGLKLWQLRYTGAYRVLTDTPLPDPELVLREIRKECPGLDIDLLSMDKLRI